MRTISLFCHRYINILFLRRRLPPHSLPECFMIYHFSQCVQFDHQFVDAGHTRTVASFSLYPLPLPEDSTMRIPFLVILSWAAQLKALPSNDSHVVNDSPIQYADKWNTSTTLYTEPFFPASDNRRLCTAEGLWTTHDPVQPGEATVTPDCIVLIDHIKSKPGAWLVLKKLPEGYEPSNDDNGVIARRMYQPCP